MSLFEDIAAAVAEATGDILPDVVITRTIKAPVDTSTGKRPAPATVTLTAKGSRGEYAAWMRAQKLVGEKSVQILIIAGTVKHPDGSPGVIMEEDVAAIGGERFRLSKIKKDPASATFDCEGAGWTGD